jgi:hypothetical protein
MYIDNADGTQIFIDPSGATENMNGGENAMQFFADNHVWLPDARTATVVRLRKDNKRSPGSLQGYFAHPDDEKHGHCVMVTHLIIILCLRFRCSDPQFMVDIIQRVMQAFIREGINGDFIRRLQAWQAQPRSCESRPRLLPIG